ncbi:MAG: class I SAM-dependent methyltransferase, partial [Alphaproteobacteria bacterium]|nr:class I SAM-dependent methyltransferase [Alphaproteobacteria bacterium]
MTKAFADAGSYRDPSGCIYEVGGEIYRAVMERAAPEFAYLRESGLLAKLAGKGRVVAT